MEKLAGARPQAHSGHVSTSPIASLKLKLQIYHGDDIAMGPGKADLLEAIMLHGSISAAGRALGMSYRRCWMLVEIMNRCWRAPLVESSTGGPGGGGATVTQTGQQVLALYRSMQQTLDIHADGRDWVTLQELLCPASCA